MLHFLVLSNLLQLEPQAELGKGQRNARGLDPDDGCFLPPKAFHRIPAIQDISRSLTVGIVAPEVLLQISQDHWKGQLA